MEILNLILLPIDADVKRFQVVVSKYGKTESSLPFFEEEKDWRKTVLRCLEVTNFKSDKPDALPRFDSTEQEWMVKAGILNKNKNLFVDEYLVNIGKAVYQALFPVDSKAQKALIAALGRIQGNTQLHIQLEFSADAVNKSRLSDYPWELVHDGEKFLFQRNVIISRYIAHETVPPRLLPTDKVNVLLASSRASDSDLNLHSLDDQEVEAIRQVLANAGHINLVELKNVTREKLEKYLREHQGEDAPHVLHFDGHGIFAKRCSHCHTVNRYKAEECSNSECKKTEFAQPKGYLVFENGKKPDYVSATGFSESLRLSSLGDGKNKSGGIALVVLSACQSAMALDGDWVFNGVAQNLISIQIPSVVAMQYSVSVEYAKKFAELFYHSLGLKNSLVTAISQARGNMENQNERNQWYRPVLYLRWQDNEGGKLFSDSPVPKLNQPEKEDNTQDLLKELRKLNEPKNEEISRNIQRAYRACYSGKDWTYKKTYDVAAILADVKNMPQGSLQYPRIDHFVLCLAAYLQTSKINCGDLRKWAESNINNFSEKFNQEISNIQQKDNQKDSSLLIAIAKNTQKSTSSKNSNYYTAKAWFIEDSESYQSQNDFGCEPIILSEFDERDFDIDELDKVLNKCIQNINDFDWSKLIIEIFLPLDMLNYPVHLCKLEHALIGQDYRIVVRYSERAQKNLSKLYKNNWEKKWKTLQNFSCFSVSSAFLLADENYADNLKSELERQDIIGLKFVKQHKNIKDIFTQILRTGIPVALWLQEHSLDLQECQSEIEQILNCCICHLPESVKQKRNQAKPNIDTHIGNHLSLLWDNPYLLPPDINYK
ncbi:CHAT domain-containing protein [Nostoc muscorum FACHB-395]|nr:CHAT domain-containing protein [Desmonostoc muscorum FACHB-395]